jgi:hypothetical protein
MALPTLARFNPSLLIAKTRELVQSIINRSKMTLTSLAWDLPSYSALLEGASLNCVRDVYRAYVGGQRDWTDIDEQLIVNELLRTLFPHLTAAAQLELLLTAPSDVGEFLTLRYAIKTLSAEELEACLTKAHTQETSVRWNGYFSLPLPTSTTSPPGAES